MLPLLNPLIAFIIRVCRVYPVWINAVVLFAKSLKHIVCRCIAQALIIPKLNLRSRAPRCRTLIATVQLKKRRKLCVVIAKRRLRRPPSKLKGARRKWEHCVVLAAVKNTPT